MVSGMYCVEYFLDYIYNFILILKNNLINISFSFLLFDRNLLVCFRCVVSFCEMVVVEIKFDSVLNSNQNI